MATSAYHPRPRASAVRELTRQEITRRTDRLGIDPDEADQFVVDVFLQIASALEDGCCLLLYSDGRKREVGFNRYWHLGQPPLTGVSESVTRPLRVLNAVSSRGPARGGLVKG